jgi:hypothetical protein
MNSMLTFAYEFSPSGDDFGWLTARVETPDFSGENGMWVQWQDVAEFGEALARYPIEAADPVTGEWGFGEDGTYEIVTKVAIAPESATGALLVDVLLANYYEPANRCRTRFRTDYPATARFREQIARMMQQDSRTAILRGSKQIG